MPKNLPLFWRLTPTILFVNSIVGACFILYCILFDLPFKTFENSIIAAIGTIFIFIFLIICLISVLFALLASYQNKWRDKYSNLLIIVSGIFLISAIYSLTFYSFRLYVGRGVTALLIYGIPFNVLMIIISIVSFKYSKKSP